MLRAGMKVKVGPPRGLEDHILYKGKTFVGTVEHVETWFVVVSLGMTYPYIYKHEDILEVLGGENVG